MADDSKPRLGGGDVNINLMNGSGDPESFTLVPSYNAARVLSAQTGGMLKAMQRVMDGDIEAVVSIITLGLGYGMASNRAPKDLAERVWKTGMSDETGGLGERCITYLRILMAGGRLPGVTSEGGQDGAERP